MLNLFYLILMFPYSGSISAMVSIGKSMGENNAQKATTQAKIIVVLVLFMNIVISVLLTVFSDLIGQFFTNSQELIDLIVKDLWVMGLAFILIGLGAA